VGRLDAVRSVVTPRGRAPTVSSRASRRRGRVLASRSIDADDLVQADWPFEALQLVRSKVAEAGAGKLSLLIVKKRPCRLRDQGLAAPSSGGDPGGAVNRKAENAFACR